MSVWLAGSQVPTGRPTRVPTQAPTVFTASLSLTSTAYTRSAARTIKVKGSAPSLSASSPPALPFLPRHCRHGRAVSAACGQVINPNSSALAVLGSAVASVKSAVWTSPNASIASYLGSESDSQPPAGR